MAELNSVVRVPSEPIYLKVALFVPPKCFAQPEDSRRGADPRGFSRERTLYDIEPVHTVSLRKNVQARSGFYPFSFERWKKKPEEPL